jgi:hypothetical protein
VKFNLLQESTYFNSFLTKKEHPGKKSSGNKRPGTPWKKYHQETHNQSTNVLYSIIAALN